MDKLESHRGMKVIGIILMIYALLVATHEGEFWPFSIYPMFSQAGNPWTRAMVIDVTQVPEEEFWKAKHLGENVGDPVALRDIGVNQIDFSNFMSKTENWTASRRETLRQMLGTEHIGTRYWMATKVHGQMVGRDSVVVAFQPFLLVTADTVLTNPYLDNSHYAGEE